MNFNRCKRSSRPRPRPRRSPRVWLFWGGRLGRPADWAGWALHAYLAMSLLGVAAAQKERRGGQWKEVGLPTFIEEVIVPRAAKPQRR